MTLLSRADRVDHGFLDVVEGGNKPKLYTIKLPEGANSGVTVGRGVDLRWWTDANLQQAGVNREIRLMLQPFLARGYKDFGPKGEEAMRVLELSTLQEYLFSPQELALFNSMAYVPIWNEVSSSFNSNNSFGATFDQLPVAVQTVAFSLRYNTGVPSPIFMGHIGAGRFEKAADELRNGFSGNKLRRSQEAEFLEAAIRSGDIPANATDGRC